MNTKENTNKERLSKEEASLNYYFNGLLESIDQKNAQSSIFFLSRIVETQRVKLETNRVMLLWLLGLSMFNFLLVLSLMYILILK